MAASTAAAAAAAGAARSAKPPRRGRRWHRQCLLRALPTARRPSAAGRQHAGWDGRNHSNRYSSRLGSPDRDGCRCLPGRAVGRCTDSAGAGRGSTAAACPRRLSDHVAQSAAATIDVAQVCVISPAY